MNLPQAKFREVVFQMLYSKLQGEPGDKEIVDLLMRELKITRKAAKQALERVEAILAKTEELDAAIRQVSTSFEFERIQATEKAVLRLGLYEMLHDEEIPPKVAITEGMRIARKFSSAEASGFVNAILDTLYKKSLGEEIDQAALEESAAALRESEELAEKVGEEKANEGES